MNIAMKTDSCHTYYDYNILLPNISIATWDPHSPPHHHPTTPLRLVILRVNIESYCKCLWQNLFDLLTYAMYILIKPFIYGCDFEETFRFFYTNQNSSSLFKSITKILHCLLYPWDRTTMHMIGNGLKSS